MLKSSNLSNVQLRQQKGWIHDDVHGKNAVEIFGKGKYRAATERQQAHLVSWSVQMLPGFVFLSNIICRCSTTGLL